MGNAYRRSFANALRLLVECGYAEHQLEVAGKENRKFQQARSLLFGESSCFLLTEADRDWAMQLLLNESEQARKRSSKKKRQTPIFDEQERELPVGSVIVKKFRQPAAGQELVLLSFQELKWVSEIDNPLAVRRDRNVKELLQQTIVNLNRKQRVPLIRFGGNGSGTRIRWMYL